MRVSALLRTVATAVVLALASSAVSADSPAQTPSPTTLSWEDIVVRARGQTVHFNAWAGDAKVNAYIAWAADRVRADYGINLRHVKIADTATVVARVLAEKAAGRDTGGSVDLVWINGENFASMKANGLLFGPFTDRLPNYRLVDTEDKPTTTMDFTIPVDGLEAAWGMAQIVFQYDTARLTDPPRDMAALLAWARANPGRFTYPQPPDFTGSTFLKQALLELAPDPSVLYEPATDEAFEAATEPLWAWLDALRPHLWRNGQAFPPTGPAQRQLLNDGEVDISLSFDPSDASAAIAQSLLPHTVRTYVLDRGTIGNTHFLAIPFNASAKEAAMVVTNFLLSPEAQIRKQDPRAWGDFTILDIDKLEPADRERFANLPRGVATLTPEELGRPIPEPHPSWMTRLEAEWQRRHASN